MTTKDSGTPKSERAAATFQHSRLGQARALSALFLLPAMALSSACKEKSADGASAETAAQALGATKKATPVAQIELSNPSEFARPDEPIAVSFHDLGLAAGDERIQSLGVKMGGKWIPSQLVDRDADGNDDTLMTLASFGATQTVSLEIVSDASAERDFPARAHAEISVKKGGEWKPRKDKPELKEYVGGSWESVKRFSPPAEHTDHSQLIRYEGPGIESDLVAYRVYLDPRNGFDAFGKKTKEPVLARVGLDGYDSYHEMADWGMDILKVGDSLGTGGFGFYDGKTVDRGKNLEGWTVDVIEDGPIYASFATKYEKWKVADKVVDARAIFSMTAGSRLVEARVELSEDLPNLAIGTAKHPNTEEISGPTDITGRAHTYVGSWGKQSLSGKDDELGLAVIFQRGSRDEQIDDGVSRVSVMDPTARQVSYHFLAAWQGEPGGIGSREQFESYLQQQSERLTIPLRHRLSTALSQSEKKPITAETALAWAKRLADSELKRKTLNYHYDGWDENRQRKPKFEYDIVGLQPLAYHVLNGVAPDPRYASVVEKVSGSFVTDAGEIRAYDETTYNIDSVAPGRNLLLLHQQTKAEKYKKAADVLRRQLEHHPKTSEGAFWHKKRYPWQLWLDGVYMGLPFLAHYSALYEDGKSLEQVVEEFVITRRRLRDDKTGLYYHAWDEKKQQSWADPETGRSRLFWARGLGWYAMALVDVLDYLPQDDAKLRKPMIDMIQELAPALLAVRDPATKTWWQILDRPKAPGNYRESTASAMFSYFLAKAVQKGYLPRDPYEKAAVESFQGMVDEFVLVHADGTITMDNQCLVAGLGYGRDGSYRYYMSEPIWKNDPKGNGPFILAGVAVNQMLAK